MGPERKEQAARQKKLVREFLLDPSIITVGRPANTVTVRQIRPCLSKPAQLVRHAPNAGGGRF
jgi:hypothetical protein